MIIPKEFWREFSLEQFKDLMMRRNGTLDAMECRRLWQLLGRRDPPPLSFQVGFKTEDVLRLWPPITRH